MQCSQGAPQKCRSDPQSKRTYLYVLVLESSWTGGSGPKSAHCCGAHCSALSCRGFSGGHSGTGRRAWCPVQISTSSKVAQDQQGVWVGGGEIGLFPGTAWSRMSGDVITLVVQIKGNTHIMLMLGNTKLQDARTASGVSAPSSCDPDAENRKCFFSGFTYWVRVSKASSSNLHMFTSANAPLLTLSPFHSLLYGCTHIHTHSVMRTHRHKDGAPVYIQYLCQSADSRHPFVIN